MDSEKEIELEHSRFNATGTILLLYTLPLIALTTYSWWARDSWNIWVVGLLLVSFGTYFFASMMHGFASQVSSPTLPMESVTAKPLTPDPQADEKIKELEQQLKAYSNMVEDWKGKAYAHEEHALQVNKEQEEVQTRLDQLSEEYEHYKLEAQHLIEEERNVLEAHRQTIEEQKNTLEQNQQLILTLETKSRDLNYELKTLLKLAEKEGRNEKKEKALPEIKGGDDLYPPLVKNPHLIDADRDADFGYLSEGHIHATISEDKYPKDAREMYPGNGKFQLEAGIMELKRCIDAAQRIVGINSFGSQPKLNLDNSAIDLRRLFERLSEVKSGAVFVYSPLEKRVIFVNGGAKSVWGVAPDQIQQQFNEWLQKENVSWNEALGPLSYKGETKLDLLMGAHSMRGYLGVIPSGLFRNMVIGFCS